MVTWLEIAAHHNTNQDLAAAVVPVVIAIAVANQGITPLTAEVKYHTFLAPLINRGDHTRIPQKIKLMRRGSTAHER